MPCVLTTVGENSKAVHSMTSFEKKILRFERVLHYSIPELPINVNLVFKFLRPPNEK